MLPSQQTVEWLDYRRSRIGSSDAPVIMGVSPWMTPYQLWESKLGLREKEPNPWMIRGLELEEEARKYFEKERGVIVFPEVLVHPFYDWMMASFDGITMDHKIAVEIKCPGATDHAIAASGKVPEKYYPQLQHQMLVAGLCEITYVSYTENSVVMLDVQKDLQYVQKMIMKEIEFYRCMQEMEPPPLTERDYNVRSDDIWRETASQYIDVKTQLEELSKQEKKLKESLVAMCEGKNTRGCGISLNKFVRRGSISYKDIPELKDVDLEKYRSLPTEIYRITPYE